MEQWGGKVDMLVSGAQVLSALGLALMMVTTNNAVSTPLRRNFFFFFFFFDFFLKCYNMPVTHSESHAT